MRLWSRLFRAVVIILVLIAGTSAMVVVVSQTAWFKNWLRGYIVAEAQKYVNGEVSIQRLGGNLFYGLELEGIAISMDGKPVASVKDVGVRYNVFQMVSSGISIDELRMNELVLYLRRDPDGHWSLARLIKKQEREADREGPAYPITVDTIGLSNAAVLIDPPTESTAVRLPSRIERLDAKLAFHYEPVRYTIDIAHTSFRASDPAIGLNSLSGRVSVKDDGIFLDTVAIRTEETSVSVNGGVQNYLTKPVFNLQISSDKTSLPELAHVIPALGGIDVQPAFELTIDGPLDRLGVNMNVRSSAGQMTGALIADVLAPGESAQGSVSVQHLDLKKLLNDSRQPGDLSGNARIDLQAKSFSNPDSVRGTVSIDSPKIAAFGYAADHIAADAQIEGRRLTISGHANAYGASVTTNGRVIVPKGEEATAFDLRGRARHVDLRRLPRQLSVPRAQSNLNADYHVAGTTVALRGDARLAESTVAGAGIAAGGTAAFEIGRGEPSYRADATVSHLDLQKIGTAFRVEALTADRYRTAINGHVSIEGRGRDLKNLKGTARGTLTDSSALGAGIPRLAFDASLDHDVAHVVVDGAITDLDPASISGKPEISGTVGGTLNVDATVNGVSEGVRVDNVAGTALVKLDKSTIGGVAIDHATIDADYQDQVGDIRTFEILGADVNATAKGRLAINETAQSNLEVHADTSSLETVGRLFDLTLTGGLKTDATITGNRAELQAAGSLVGFNLSYADNSALTAASDYVAKVPDLTFARATITADTRATFVTVAGQNINELIAKTTYADETLTFDGTAKAPERSVDAAGSLALHAEHREVHLQRLALATAGQEWTLAPDGSPTIRYAPDAIVVDGLTLVNGDQRVTAAGTFGRPDDALKVTLANVDLASVDALLLRPPQLTGRLNASSTVSGTKASPVVKGQFEVVQGGFRDFRYERFSGTAEYSGQGVTLEARLQESPSQVITAKGYVPTAVFTAKPETAGERIHSEPTTSAEQIDLTIESTPMNLGLIQGFTSDLTGVAGTVEAHLHVTGSAADPHPDGSLTFADGTMTVVPTGVSYTNIAGQVEFQPDRIHVEQITVLDNQFEALSITGDLALHGADLGVVDLWINTNDFKIVDNEMGNVRVQTAIELTGDLRAPFVRGDLGVSTGRVDLDALLALAGPSAYATKQTEYVRPATLQVEEQTPGSLFDRLRLDVRLGVPDDLVVKADELRTPGAPVSLGALNVTLGGNLSATKAPGGRVLVVGSVNTIRGTYEFQGRRFDILRDGSVRFEGLDELDPTLDLRARREIQSVEARVNVRGTLSRPEITLSSTPPLEDAEILALVLFNQPLNQLGESQQMSLLEQGQGVATGALSNQLSRSIGKALNLNTFEIELAPQAGTAASVTLGQQVGQNLYVKVQQGIGDQSRTNFILEYELMKWLRLQTTIVQGSSTQPSLFRRQESTGGDLLFFFSK